MTVCDQCAKNTANQARLEVTRFHSTYAEHLHFCDELCLLKWCADQREALLDNWRNQALESRGKR